MNLTIYRNNKPETIIPSRQIKEIESSLKQIKIKKGASSKEIRVSILKSLTLLGWSEPVRISKNSKINVTSMKDQTALCLQTGNMGRFYADLLKLQKLFLDKKIKSAIYIIPDKLEAKKIGSNVANFERLCEELTIFQKIITVPMLVLGFGEG